MGLTFDARVASCEPRLTPRPEKHEPAPQDHVIATPDKAELAQLRTIDSAKELHPFPLSKELMRKSISEGTLTYLGGGREATVFALPDNNVIRVSNDAPANWLDLLDSEQQVVASPMPAALNDPSRIALPKALIDPHIGRENLLHAQLCGTPDKVGDKDATVCHGMIMSKLSGTPTPKPFQQKFDELFYRKEMMRLWRKAEVDSKISRVQKNTLSESQCDNTLATKAEKSFLRARKIQNSVKSQAIYEVGMSFIRDALFSRYSSDDDYAQEVRAEQYRFTSEFSRQPIDCRFKAEDTVDPRKAPSILSVSPQARARRRFVKKYDRFVESYLKRINAVSQIDQGEFTIATTHLHNLNHYGFGIDGQHGENMLIDEKTEANSIFGFQERRAIELRMLCPRSCRPRSPKHMEIDRTRKRPRTFNAGALKRIIAKVDIAAQKAGMEWQQNPYNKDADVKAFRCMLLSFAKYGLRSPYPPAKMV